MIQEGLSLFQVPRSWSESVDNNPRKLIRAFYLNYKSACNNPK